MLFMNRNKKGLHKVTANVLSLTLASVMVAGAAGEAVSSVSVYAAETSQTDETKTDTFVYLNGTLEGEEEGDGTTKEKAVSSIEQALKLAGSQGTILVCGPITVSSEKTLTIPSGVQIKRAQDYAGAVIKITGKGKLTLSGGNLQTDDVDTSAAELGSGAFVQKVKEETEETKKAGQVTMVSKVSIVSPEGWNSFDFSAAGFAGEGTFAWASQTAPTQYQSAVQIIFTPKDTENYDYSEIEGWDNARGVVVRTVEVTIESLKPEEPVQPSESEDGQQSDSQDQTENDQENKEDSQEPADQDPEETAPAAPEVTVPSEVKVAAPEELIDFDFSAAGFAGEGTFSWENENLPTASETEMKVIFTPADTESKDYSKVEGWDAQKGQVIRTVKVLVESLKEDASENTEEKEETPDQDTGISSGTDQDTSAEEGEDDKEQTETDDSGSTTEEKDSEMEEDQESQGEDQESQEEENSSEESDEEEGFIQAEPGKTGEVAQEIPEAIPVGSLIDENTGVRVEGDFLPYYVDLQVSYNEDLSQFPDAGIGEILSAYEIKLWDLKEDEEYVIPEGKRVRVMIPLPENADSFSQISIAHYLGNSEYEYYTLPTEDYPGNLTIIHIEGTEFLTFETASFSPFNVGGSQLVGPGTQIPQSGSSGQNSGSGTSGGTSSENSQTSSSGSSAGQSLIQPSGNSGNRTSTQSRNTANNSSSSRITRVVKTGDETPIFLYVAAGAAAVVLAVAAIILGKKKRS